jgi:hypothetical protein
VSPEREGQAPFERELLELYKPRYLLDSQEAYALLAAASMTDNPGNTLDAEDGTTIARAGADNGLGLATLEDYPDERRMAATDELRHAEDRLGDAVQMALRERGGQYPRRVYGRVLDDGDYKWLQYWGWYYHNPKRIIGFGSHEGDWELTQIGLGPDDKPRVVTFAQHNGGEAKEWGELERVDGTHAVVYVALFSHAAYFEAGTQAYAARFLADNPDGRGPVIDPIVEPFEPWTAWPGRWGRGSDRGHQFRGKYGGLGPESPGCQEGRWRTPATFHAQGRRRRPRDRRVLWNLGRLTYPLDPRELEILEVDSDSVRVRYKLPLLRRGNRLLITIHDPQRSDTPLIGSGWVSRPPRASQRDVPLISPPRGDQVVARCSTFNLIDQRSITYPPDPAASA